MGEQQTHRRLGGRRGSGWVATVLAVAGILSTWAAGGWDWTDALSGAAITLAAQRVVAYLVPNQDAPGGVPTANDPKI